MTKSVYIKIDPTDLESLKHDKYKICFAKKVANTYDVVWQSYDKFLAGNTFSWIPMYQLFATNTFSGGVQVRADTDPVSITLGEQATLDDAGALGPAVSGGPTDSITLKNNYGLIHPGLNSVSIGLDGVQNTTPIYVAPLAMEPGIDILTPVDMVQVWFQQDIQTSTMISSAVSNPVEIDLTTMDSASRLYSNGIWSTIAGDAVADPASFVTMTVAVVGSITAALLAVKLGTYLTSVYNVFSVNVNATAGIFTISYKDKPGLSTAQRRHLTLLKTTPAMADQLVAYTMQGLASLGLSFTTISVKATT
jgi:hypothetical protein